MRRTASASAGDAIGKPGFDDVHAERVELTRQLQLLRRTQREPGRLLAVTQRRVEDPDLFHVATPIADYWPSSSRRDWAADNVKMIIILFEL